MAVSIERQEFEFKCRVAAESLDELFNPDGERTLGIVLMVFPLEDGALCSYLTNGISPEDVQRLMKQQVEAGEEALNETHTTFGKMGEA